MEEIKRNWSAIRDYLGGNFGQRAFYTREHWIEQCWEWCYGGMPEDDYEQLDEEERDYMDWLNGMSDEDLMHYIQENWEIEIRETTWLRDGNICLMRYNTSQGEQCREVKILEIPLNSDGELTEFTDILCELDGKTCKLPIFCLYGLTDKFCPKCGHSLYVSDLCSYPYVCLKCDENFGHNEAV